MNGKARYKFRYLLRICSGTEMKSRRFAHGWGSPELSALSQGYLFILLEKELI